MSENFKKSIPGFILGIIFIFLGLFILIFKSKIFFFGVSAIFIGIILIVANYIEYRARLSNPEFDDEEFNSEFNPEKDSKIIIRHPINRHRGRGKRVKSPMGLMLFGGIFFVIGVFIEITIFGAFSNNIDFITNGTKTTATVVSYTKHRNTSRKLSKRTITYSNNLKFYIDDTPIIAEDTSAASNPPSHDIGEVVEIVYDKDNPSNVRINSIFNIFILPLIFIIGFSFFIIYGSFTFIKGAKKLFNN